MSSLSLRASLESLLLCGGPKVSVEEVSPNSLACPRPL